MRCRILVRATGVGLVLLLIAGVIGCSLGGKEKSKGANQDTSSALSVAEKAETSFDKADSSLPKLPETSPPPGLPIIPWGKRDHFPVIRRPEYWTLKQAEGNLAHDEPILGLVIGNEARA